MVSGHASGEAVVGVTITFTIIATASTALRLYTRFVIVQSTGLDDAFIAAAMLFTVVLTATMCVQVKYGMGRHHQTLTPHEEMYSLIWFWASVWIYYIGLFCAKISILLQYLRIFPNPIFRKLTIGMIIFVTLYGLWTVCSAIWACTPINFFWQQGMKQGAEGSCLNRLAVWFTNAALNILSDVVVTALPLPLIKTLNLPKSSRVALTMIFCLGAVTCIVSLLRLQSLYAISISDDVSWSNGQAAIFSNLEVNIGITCCCLPSLKACINRMYPHFFSSGRSHPSGRTNPRSGLPSFPGLRSKQLDTELDPIKTNVEANVLEGPFEGPKRSLDGAECSYVHPGTEVRIGDQKSQGSFGGIRVQRVVEQRQSPVPGSRSPSLSESTRELVRAQS